MNSGGWTDQQIRLKDRIQRPMRSRTSDKPSDQCTDIEVLIAVSVVIYIGMIFFFFFGAAAQRGLWPPHS